MKTYTLGLMLALAVSATAQPQPTDADRAKCFIDNDGDKSVTFIFDNNLWKVSGLQSVEVRGSFTSWGASDDFVMTYDADGDFWHVTAPYSAVKIPGNSGQPEFKFVTNGSSWQSGSSKSFIPEGYVFRNSDKNNIVVFNSDDFETIKANSASANVVKTLDDFDLSTAEGQEEISNFRRVPGTTMLYRCYHPFKYSRDTYATEPVRIQYVDELSVQHGVQSDICLSGDDTGSLTSYTIGGVKYTESVPDYYQAVLDNGHVLYVGTVNGTTPSYNAVYYRANNDIFCQWIREVADFIIDDSTPMPATIHCRLGTDRTGVFCAVLAALCGADWTDIAADYQKSNRMGILEFRDYHLLQYAMQLILGVDDINAVEDLSAAMAAYFIGNGTLTQDDIDALRAKLCAEPSAVSDIAAAAAADATPAYYDLQGIKVSAPQSGGIYVRRRGDSTDKIRY
ncbi:MAG: tyrosine-protein phosphatase [Muribaculaceae bacterium]